MKIVGLQVENIKRLVAVDIRPDGNLVQITGRNGQGKTSVLDAIWWALAGLSNVQGMPIRKGETKAKIRLDLGTIVVTRTFETEDGIDFTSKITVEDSDGVRKNTPQTLLDALFGELSFDPLDFARSSPHDQFETLKGFVPGVDFAAIEKAEKADYDERQSIHRQARDHKGAAEKIEVPLDLTIQRVDETELVEELDRAGRHNADIETRKANRERMAVDIKTRRQKATDLTARVEALRAEAKVLEQEAEAEVYQAGQLEQKLKDAPALPTPIDTEPIKTHIKEAKDVNAKVDLLEKRRSHLTEEARLNDEADKITDRMRAREEDKRRKIADADLPIKNVAFGDGQILMNGVPFNQASDAEQLRASVSIAMAMNPKLRVIRVRDGSLLDDESLKVLADMALEGDYQVWVERVDSSGKVGFVIEAGQVVKRQEVLA